MFWLKACTRCGGDLAAGNDHYGQYVSCLQCGATRETTVTQAQTTVAVPAPNTPATELAANEYPERVLASATA